MFEFNNISVLLTISETKMLTTLYVRLSVLLDFIPTNLGDALKFKVATIFQLSQFSCRYKPWNYFQFGVKRLNLFKKHAGLSKIWSIVCLVILICFRFWGNFKVWEKDICY